MTKILRLEISTFKLGVKFYFAARLFPPYFALLRYIRNCKQKAARSASVTDERVRSLASFAAASSDVKILHLDFFLFKFKVKFLNFGSNFTCRNPRFENINLVAIVPQGLAIKFARSPAAKFNVVHKTKLALARLNLMRQDLFRQQLLYRGDHFI